MELNNKSTNTTITECDSVSNIQYYQKGDKINLSWNVPGQVSLSHSGEYDNNGVGAGMGLTVGHKFEPEDLINYIGYSIIKISFVPYADHGTFTVKVWKETDGVLEVVASQPVTRVVAEQSNTVTLLNPVVIEDSSTYYFGYQAQNNGFPAGVDAGPAVVGKGDIYLNWDNKWYSIYEQAGANFNYNFCIKLQLYLVHAIAFQSDLMFCVTIHYLTTHLFRHIPTKIFIMVNRNIALRHSTVIALRSVIAYWWM